MIKKPSTSTLLSVVAIAATIIVSLLQPFWVSIVDDNKSLEYNLSYETKLAGGGENNWPLLKINYDNKQQKDVRISGLSIENTGSEPILTSDFDAPLAIIFDSGTTVLSARVASSSPSRMPINPSYSSNKVYIQPLLLNPSDSFTIEALVAGNGGFNTVDVRITGVSEAGRKKFDFNNGMYFSIRENSSPQSRTFIETLKIELSDLIIISISVIIFIICTSYYYDESSLIKKPQKASKTTIGISTNSSNNPSIDDELFLFFFKSIGVRCIDI
ncbi:hypothetical protein [Vibrio sp. 10N.261.51.F12]|uniref:hypothetical protein n=1 Tax=Vibrio sp. 10N.261.51.F12 TaxID=3229679 RepID=UPI0035508D4D